jgi:hypothetical protein
MAVTPQSAMGTGEGEFDAARYITIDVKAVMGTTDKRDTVPDERHRELERSGLGLGRRHPRPVVITCEPTEFVCMLLDIVGARIDDLHRDRRNPGPRAIDGAWAVEKHEALRYFAGVGGGRGCSP